MKKIKNLIILTFIFIIACSTIVFATDINMNLPSYSQTDNTIANETNNMNTNTNATQNEISNNMGQNSYNDAYSSSSTTVSSVPSVTEEGFGLSQILNIFLIVVGVILILLGIAILIRLHS